MWGGCGGGGGGGKRQTHCCSVCAGPLAPTAGILSHSCASPQPGRPTYVCSRFERRERKGLIQHDTFWANKRGCGALSKYHLTGQPE